MPIAQAIAQDRLRIARSGRQPAPQVFLRKSRQEIHGPPEPETNLKSPDQPSPISSGRSVRMIAPKRLPRSSKRTGLQLFPTPMGNNTHTSPEYRNPCPRPKSSGLCSAFSISHLGLQTFDWEGEYSGRIRVRRHRRRSRRRTPRSAPHDFPTPPPERLVGLLASNDVYQDLEEGLLV